MRKAEPDMQGVDMRSPDTRDGARSSWASQAVWNWLAAEPAERRVWNEVRTRWSVGHEPRPQAHKEGWLLRLWPRDRSISHCVLQSTSVFPFRLLM
jgi:hypothetical protein